MALSSLRPQAAALLALLSLALAGCQLIPRSASDSGGWSPSASESAARPSVDDEAGPTLPAGETRNRVAVLVPLTGPNAAVGQSIANAANLALADSGSTRIRVTAYDTAPGPAAAASEAVREGNGLFLGPLLAEDALAVGPVARAANVPVIAFSNDVTVAGAGVHVLGLNPAQSIERVVAHAREQGMTRFGALLPTSLYGERAGLAVASAVRRAGGQLVAVRTYERSAEALRASAADLATQGPFDAVLIADGTRMAALAAPALRRRAPQLRLLGTELWASEANPGAQAALRGAWFAGPPDANFDAFRSRYRARYNRDPHRLASLGYDAVLLAARIGVDWRLGRRFPMRALRDEGGFSGIDGAFRFDRDGVAERALEVLEVNANGTTSVSPAPASFRGR
jgi:ABC-type branched-subunit amino acid transport system substrate-binding protein